MRREKPNIIELIFCGRGFTESGVYHAHAMQNSVAEKN
jgi:hypothetical protein